MGVADARRSAERACIKEIRVFELQTGVKCLRWEVIGYAIADSLEVVAGQAPEGFTQVYPRQGEIFTPVRGGTYEIAVVTDGVPEGPLGTKTAWVAE
jgi:hypothetical protein